MRHRKKLKKLGLKKSHRDSLLRNLVSSLVLEERLRTTKLRGKALQARFSRMMSLVQKKPAREAIRLIPAYCNIAAASKKVMAVLVPKYKDRTSGFTRLTPVGMRKGDNAELVQVELV